MILMAIILIYVVALAIDMYIYRRVIRRHNFGRIWTVGYVVYALVLYLSIVSALLLHKVAKVQESVLGMTLMMWVIFLFFLNFMPKAVYALVSLGDYAVRVFTHRRSHIFGYAGIFLGLCAVSVMLWGATVGRNSVEVRGVEVRSERLPASFDGFKIAVISDIHIGTRINSEDFLEEMVKELNSMDADMVAQCGDLVNMTVDELNEDIAEELSQIRAKRGVFSVMGNHDQGRYLLAGSKMTPQQAIVELSMKQRAMGWNLLDDENTYIYSGADSIAVVGISYYHELSGRDFEKNFAGVSDSTYSVVLAHDPRTWNLTNKGDLMLSGHVHSMQIKLRIGNFVWSPAKWMYEQWSGLYNRDNRHLYVNDGMGCVMYPMRIGTRPEITLIELRSTQKI